MKRFSRGWFSQIMVHKFLKRELDRLKDLVAIEAKINYNPSYGDVIKFLVHFYKENSQSVRLPTIVVQRSGTTISRGTVISTKRGVTGKW